MSFLPLRPGGLDRDHAAMLGATAIGRPQRLDLGAPAGGAGPALDAARRLDPRDRGDEVGTGQPIRRRKGLARLVVGPLLGDGRPTVGAADGDAAEGSRAAAELPLDER